MSRQAVTGGIQTRTCYTAVCGTCHRSPASSVPAFTSDDARETAERAGWLVTKTIVRCPACQNDSEHDDAMDRLIARTEAALDLDERLDEMSCA